MTRKKGFLHHIERRIALNRNGQITIVRDRLPVGTRCGGHFIALLSSATTSCFDAPNSATISTLIARNAATTSLSMQQDPSPKLVWSCGRQLIYFCASMFGNRERIIKVASTRLSPRTNNVSLDRNTGSYCWIILQTSKVTASGQAGLAVW